MTSGWMSIATAVVGLFGGAALGAVITSWANLRIRLHEQRARREEQQLQLRHEIARASSEQRRSVYAKCYRTLEVAADAALDLGLVSVILVWSEISPLERIQLDRESAALEEEFEAMPLADAVDGILFYVSDEVNSLARRIAHEVRMLGAVDVGLDVREFHKTEDAHHSYVTEQKGQINDLLRELKAAFQQDLEPILEVATS